MSSARQEKPMGAMALWDKYSSLDRGMEDARSENAAIKSKMESMRQEIERLRSERTELEAQTHVSREETTGLHAHVQEALVELRKLEEKIAQGLVDKTEAHRTLDFTKQYVEQQRHSFLEASRDFRTSVKRMRLSASSVGEDTAPSKAFIERNGEYCSDYDEPILLEGNDVELEQAAEEHRRRKEARDKVQRKLKDIQTKENVCAENSTSRSDRKSQLEAQLDRVRKDNTDLEEQLKALDQQTREAREMAHNYEKEVTRRRSASDGHGNAYAFMTTPFASQNPITPSPYTAPSRDEQISGRPRNPYAARRSNVTMSNKNSDSQHYQSHENNAVFGRASWNSSVDDREAHPHLTGRRRLDRQFGGASLGISSVQANVPPTILEEPTAYKTIHNPIVLEDDDDDDEDELLSYVAFSKK